MPRIDLPEGEPLYTWMSFRPEMAPGVAALSDDCTVCQRSRSAKADEGGVTEDLYEGVKDWRDHDGFTAREKMAAEFAERFTTDHLSMDDAFFVRLREQFDDGEI